MEEVSKYSCYRTIKNRKNLTLTFANISKSNHSHVIHPEGLTFGEVKNKVHL